jgi:hypothetical protein
MSPALILLGVLTLIKFAFAFRVSLVRIGAIRGKKVEDKKQQAEINQTFLQCAYVVV